MDADGQRRQVDAVSDPDLFWALRGGGGDYAFVTSLHFNLKPAPAIYGGRISWPAERAAEVFAAFRAVTATAPDELTLWCSLSRIPNAPAMVSVDTVFLGYDAAAHQLLAPLNGIADPLTDTRRMLPANEIGTITNEPTSPMPSRQRSTLITELSDHVMGTLLDGPIDPLIFVQIRHLGGALARPSDTPTGAVSQPYLINFGGMQPNPQAGRAIAQRTSDYLNQFGPASTNRTLFNFLDHNQTAADALDTASLTRLRDVKRTRDPRGVIRSNHPVSI